MANRVRRIIPILRSFSEEKAREFYVDYLGFHVDWEHRFEPNSPLYMQVSRDGLVLHLSEHYGDALPGAHLHIEYEGVRQLHAEISAKRYKYLNPGLCEDPYWKTTVLRLIDPFGNRLEFGEPKREQQ